MINIWFFFTMIGVIYSNYKSDFTQFEFYTIMILLVISALLLEIKEKLDDN